MTERARPDRLKQIWSGFEGVTTRQLTGSGVENIERPTLRREALGANPAALPVGVPAPAAAAFEALRVRLADSEMRAARKGSGRRQKGAEATPAADFADLSIDGAPPEARAMLAGIRSTEQRTQRTSESYVARMSAEAGRELNAANRKRKGFRLF